MSPDRIRPGDAARRGDEPERDEPQEAPYEGEEDLGAEGTLEEEVPFEEGGPEDEEVAEGDVEAEAVAASLEPIDEPVATPSAFVTEALQPEAANGERGAGRPPRPPRRHGVLRRLYFGETHFDFVRRRRYWFALSLAIIAAGAISLATRGLNLDIEFVGGTAWTVQTHTVTVTQARNALAPVGLSGATITRLGAPPKTLEVEAKLPKGQSAGKSSAIATKVGDILARLAHVNPASITIEQVGPAWGTQITHKAVEALIVFFVLVSIYISLFFEWRMALAAILAMVHDILVTVGVYSLTGFDVTPDSVVAFLTIIGYSLYDTIVVFDRVRDNARHLANRDRMNLTDLINLSMNQTLARSLNTSLVAILPILSVLVLGAQILGATTLEYFGLALTIGLTTGAYSSIFIASPLVAVMKEREPRYRQLSERLRSRGIDKVLLSPVAVAAGALSQETYAPTRHAATQRAIGSRERTGPIRPGAATAVAEARTHPDAVRAALARKGADQLFDEFLAADGEWREQQRLVEALRASTRPKGRPDEAERALLAKAKEDLHEAEALLVPIAARRDDLLARLPNPPDPTAPDGATDEDAVEIRRSGEAREFDFPVREHLELGTFAMDKAAQLSGSRFAYRIGDAALVELALYRFALDRVVDRGFLPVLPPVIVREDAMFATGFLPTEEANLYHVEPDGLYLTGTSEVALAGLHADEILAADTLPRRYAGYSTCFRREAGAAGRDTRGIFRVHQFDKVEMYVFCSPETSSDEHEALLAIEEEIVRTLDIAYRVVNIAAGDLGPSAAKKYDIEAWIPSQSRYREITSCSNTTDYQSRRLNTRLRGDDERRFVHTLNGTAMTARCLIALMETFQERDGTVSVPPALITFGAPARISPTAL